MPLKFLKHSVCGHPVSIAVLQHDVAHYVWCEHCRDIVEHGELDSVDETKVRLVLFEERVRPVFDDGGS